MTRDTAAFRNAVAPSPHARRTRNRMGLTALLFAAGFLAISVRLVQISAEGSGFTAPSAGSPASTQASRADIVDRNGRLLATDVPIDALFADARHIWNPREAAKQLVSVLPDLDEAALFAKLSSGQAFVWIKRDLTPKQYAAVRSLGIAGLGIRREQTRVYPNGRAAAHILGYVDIDNRGIAGVERSLNDRLSEASAQGAPVALSIDLRVQHILEDVLSSARAEFQAIGATGLVLDVHSGEILGMASLPDYDPNHPPLPTGPDARALFNQATLGVYEMGSTFKAFTTAMALDSGRVTLTSEFDATKPIAFGRFRIRDFHPLNRWLSVAEIFQHSSNIGSARIALALGGEVQRDFLRRVGMLEAPQLELPERGRPLVPKRWGEIETMTISYGHGIAVSPIQVTAGMAAMANGGLYITPTLLRRQPNAPLPATRVISEETSAAMRELLRLVVAKGTGGKADVPGYPVGGKTGTAEKASGGGYARKALISSFVGVFPALQPRYLVLVILDEPQPTPSTHGYATGGWTAAPTVSKIVARIAPLLGLEPEPVAAPQEDPSATRMAVADDR